MSRRRRVLIDTDLQEIDVVVSASRASFRLMNDHQLVGEHLRLHKPGIPALILVARRIVIVAVTGDDLVVEKNVAHPPVIHIAHAGGLTGDPESLDLLTPSGLENFVEIDAHAHFIFGRDERETRRARVIEAPWLDPDVIELNLSVGMVFSPLLDLPACPVRAAGVGDLDQVRIFGCI